MSASQGSELLSFKIAFRDRHCPAFYSLYFSAHLESEMCGDTIQVTRRSLCGGVCVSDMPVSPRFCLVREEMQRFHRPSLLSSDCALRHTVRCPECTSAGKRNIWVPLKWGKRIQQRRPMENCIFYTVSIIFLNNKFKKCPSY